MSRQLRWFSLRFPADVSADAARTALSSLAGAPHGARFALEIQADADGINHRLGVTESHVDVAAGGLTAAIPSLRLDPLDFIERPLVTRAVWQLSRRVAAIRDDDPVGSSAALLGSLQPLRRGEAVSLTWELRPALSPPLPRPEPAAQQTGQNHALRRKLARPGMRAVAIVGVHTDSRGRARQLMQRTGAALWSRSTPFGRLAPESPALARLLRLLGQRGTHLSVDELVAVLGWPLDPVMVAGVEVGAARRLAPSRQLGRTGRVLGLSDHGLNARPVAISPKASTRGLYLLGPTGTGKTSLIKNLVMDDLRAGRGVAVIETNGDLITDLLDLIPPEREGDVVLLDPTDASHAVGLNPFRATADPALAADQLNELFQRLWAAYWGPRTGQLAHMALLTLARRPDSTLVDLPRLYLDSTFRASVLHGLDDPVGLEPDWQWFQSLAEREQAVVVAPLLNKIRQFTARPSIRAIIGQPQPAITMQRVLAENKILLVNLPKGLIGRETATLLGSMTLIGLWQAFTERARQNVADRRSFGVYVDEVQDFAAAPVPWEEMFSQGRKYALALSVAHQNLAQLPKELREAILANARSKAVFSLSAADAKALEVVYGPALKAADLQALDPHHVAAVVALDNGGTSAPVTLATPPPPESLDSATRVRASSRQTYAVPTETVEAALRAHLRGPDTPVGRRRREPS